MPAPLNIAINGFGRIGRAVARALYEYSSAFNFKLVAINEPAELAAMAYLLNFDSVHGRFPGKIRHDHHNLFINDDAIAVFHSLQPEAINWQSAKVDLLLECSGRYGYRHEIQRFIEAGCPRVLLSHPGASAKEIEKTIVYGVNETTLKASDTLVSSASCTTNASIPVLQHLDSAFGIEHAVLTTLHAVMNDQPLIDGYHHQDLWRTRSGIQSLIPVATGLAQGVERILPQLGGKIIAKSVRVPIANVSAIDMVVRLSKPISLEQLKQSLATLAQQHPGIIDYIDTPHVSVDFNHDPHSAIIDATQMQVSSQGVVNFLVWFDNEWGFAKRMLDVATTWSAAIGRSA